MASPTPPVNGSSPADYIQKHCPELDQIISVLMKRHPNLLSASIYVVHSIVADAVGFGKLTPDGDWLEDADRLEAYLKTYQHTVVLPLEARLQ